MPLDPQMQAAAEAALNDHHHPPTDPDPATATTRPPGLRGQTCPKDDTHPAHTWISYLVEPTGEFVWCLGQPPATGEAPAPTDPDPDLEAPVLSTTRAAVHAAKIATAWYAETGRHLTGISVDLTDDGRAEIDLTLDDPDRALSDDDLDAAAAIAAGLHRGTSGEGWRQYLREGDVDVFLDVWTETPVPTYARRVRAYARNLGSAVARDRTTDAILLTAAGIGAAVALAARRALVPSRRP